MKTRWNFLFVGFCLMLLSGLVFFYGEVREHFSPAKLYQLKLSHAEKEILRQQLKTKMVQAQLEDYQATVAQVLPEALPQGQDQGSYQLRSIASTAVRTLEPFDRSSLLLERGKTFFREENYLEAQNTFRELIEKFPASPVLVEAHFFLAESLFLQSQYALCLDVIDKMLVQYPDHELTGFILLRQGQIFAARNRSGEALEIYRLVRENFKSNRDLVQQASALISEGVL